ncbi:MAG TPA: Uma2 family endonuclease [Candidatus Polarisedimenticolaceae bacterium]|nr:Uma2 family endonuclease [Candidatus Polarisedimenticolaceae bacterium]
MQHPRTPPRWTEDDLKNLPENGYRYELVEGWLLREPAPALRHGRVQSRILVPLATHVRDHGLGEVHAELGFVLAKNPDTVRAPDVCFLSSTTLARIEDETRLVQGGPDLAVEVLSPSNRREEVRGKVADLLAAGTRLVWVVDPRRKRVTAYRSLLAPQVLGEGDVLDGEDVVPGFSLPVSALFSR